MNGCSLDDAFQTAQGAPHPGCNDDEAARQARKDERRKARKSKLLGMGSYIDTASKDPDRQHLNPLPDVPAMTGSELELESFDHYNKGKKYSKSDKNPASESEYHFHKSTLDDYARNECSQHYMTVPVNGNAVVTQKKFFGAQGPTDEPYADYIPDDSSYQLQPDFTKAFQQVGVNKAGASPTLPPPATNMYWKPITPSGAQSAFIEHLPPSHLSPSSLSSSPHRSLRSAYENGEISMEEVMKKLDKLFAKLEDMNHRSTPEQLTSEMLMFISSGVFVLFLMDLLVKRSR